jgi:hypothetical protein
VKPTIKDEDRKKAMKRLMRGLLAGTCLTAATAAHASTITESADFSNTLAGALSSPLAIGTTIVNGTAANSDIDFIDFQGLLAGGAYTLQFARTDFGSLNFDDFDSLGNHVGSPGSIGATSATITGLIPVDGQLIAQVGGSEGNAYSVTLTADLAPSVPEPATSALAGLGLAAAGLLSARRRKQAR